MNSDFKIYEPTDYRNKADLERFEDSVGKLHSVGIEVERITCSDISVIPQDSETYDLVKQNGLKALPVADYLGTVVCSGEYPDDQTLADYLDAPNGTLSADKKTAPPLYNLMPPSTCGIKDAKIPKK